MCFVFHRERKGSTDQHLILRVTKLGLSEALPEPSLGRVVHHLLQRAAQLRPHNPRHHKSTVSSDHCEEATTYAKVARVEAAQGEGNPTLLVEDGGLGNSDGSRAHGARGPSVDATAVGEWGGTDAFPGFMAQVEWRRH